MPAIVDAELTLRPAASGYQAEFFVDTGRDTSPRYGPFPVRLDHARLRAAAGDPAAYGQALSAMLFDADGLREALAAARARAAERGVALRLRLWLAGGAEDLHALGWELLTLPGQSEPLCTREDILFSRYLPAGADAPPPRPKDRPRALVAIASPDDLGAGRLAPIDVPGWQTHARTGLAGMAIDWLPPRFAAAPEELSAPEELAAPEEPAGIEPAEAGAAADENHPARAAERCTLARLVERIPGQDVLFLVCHGLLSGGEGQLLLEDAHGQGELVPASALASRLGGTLRLPRLAVLVVCESAGGGQPAGGDSTAGDGSTAGDKENGAKALAALGPRLVALGIPAVLAMHGALSFETADLFFPALFRALREDGAIDWAVARARRAIAGQPDERAPVLLMSLRSGRLWSETTEQPDPQQPGRPPSAEATEKPAVPAGTDAARGNENPALLAGAEAVDQRALYAALVGDAFTLSDLEELCFTLGIDWDLLRGQTKPEKARALIRYCVSRGEYDRLVAEVRHARPGISM